MADALRLKYRLDIKMYTEIYYSFIKTAIQIKKKKKVYKLLFSRINNLVRYNKIRCTQKRILIY